MVVDLAIYWTLGSWYTSGQAPLPGLQFGGGNVHASVLSFITYCEWKMKRSEKILCDVPFFYTSDSCGYGAILSLTSNTPGKLSLGVPGLPDLPRSRHLAPSPVILPRQYTPNQINFAGLG